MPVISFGSMQIKNRRRFGTLKATSVAILVPLGATLDAQGRPGEPLWTLWGGTLGALARPGDSFSFFGTKKEKKHETRAQ